jgi:hypothetical protein
VKIRKRRQPWANERIDEERAELEREETEEQAAEKQQRKKAKPKAPKIRLKSNKVREWRSRWRVLAPSELPPITRLVLWEISDHMDWDTGDNAYPSMESIVTGTGLTMKSVRTHRNLAVDLGWLRTYERMKKHGLGLAYRVSFPSHDQKSRAPELIRKALTPKRKRRGMP